MRIKITYESRKKGLLLPIHYNYYIESLIYHTFSKEVSEALHNEGFILDKRRFKLFTFSRILKKGQRVTGNQLKRLKKDLNIKNATAFYSHKKTDTEEALFFENAINFYFSSVKNFVVEDMGSRAISIPQSSLLNQNIFVVSIEVLAPPKFENKMNIKMLSPMTMYSTMKTSDENIKTYYYSPYEKEFSELITKNAKKKYKTAYSNDIEGNLQLTPLYFEERRNRAVVYFKNTRIDGWTGVFKLEGNPELIKITYDAGLGGKNPEGFGMWEPFRDKKF
ncbi:MAG: CRISPR-associated endoribonuclease Cas6 [Caldisericota bacterium]|nr:CRISPR-associated endoribonuclease Cas6 [Caldisericota bacterium]